MLTDVTELQRALYTDWKRDDGSQSPAPFCKFCLVGNHHPAKEFHTLDCARLVYLVHYYGVKPRKSKNKKHRSGIKIVDGSEFTRSGVYGWWRTNEEFKPLITKAFEVEANA